MGKRVAAIVVWSPLLGKIAIVGMVNDVGAVALLLDTWSASRVVVLHCCGHCDANPSTRGLYTET